jgi:hypothetical protein
VVLVMVTARSSARHVVAEQLRSKCEGIREVMPMMKTETVLPARLRTRTHLHSGALVRLALHTVVTMNEMKNEDIEALLYRLRFWCCIIRV